MKTIFDTVDEKGIELLVLISDVFLNETTEENIKDWLDPNFPMERLDEYLKTFTKPSDSAKYIEDIRKVIYYQGIETVRSMSFAMTCLDSVLLAPALTNSFTLLRDMTLEQRTAFVKLLRDSPIALKRRLYKSMKSISLALFLKNSSELHDLALGYPGDEMRRSIGEIYNDKLLPMQDPPSNNSRLHVPNLDVLIIGSGSGAGVLAHTLAENGYKSLILEKGHYLKRGDDFKDGDSGKYYENELLLTDTNQEMFILAGTGIGGGSLVNWSACFKTPFKVRKEWVDDYGIDFCAKEEYDDAMEYVLKKMNVQNVPEHSFSNSVVLDGAKKLGFPAKPAQQNVRYPHEEGSGEVSALGNLFGVKQGSGNFWLREAAETGSQFMANVKVVKINRDKGKAVSVTCKDTKTGNVFEVDGFKKIVVAAGSLNTPLVLRESGFRNKHIGEHLKLHPSSSVIGVWDKSFRSKPYDMPIMTSVCTRDVDRDGKMHGPRIETLLHAPFIEGNFIPWDSSDQFRRDMLKYNSSAAILVLHRDKSEGRIYGDASNENAKVIKYSINRYDLDAIKDGVLTAADLLYIEGAKEIIYPQHNMPRFISDKPKESRSINDPEYQKWRKAADKVHLDPNLSAFGSAHQMSTCRMASTPSKGAVDLKGRLYECKDVYVADASLMPTASGVNPMVTTMSFARVVGLELVKELSNNVAKL